MTAAAAGWEMPDLDTVFQVEGRGSMTLRQILDDAGPLLAPTSPAALENLLMMYGAWESAEEMGAVLETCEGIREELRLTEEMYDPTRDRPRGSRS